MPRHVHESRFVLTGCHAVKLVSVMEKERCRRVARCEVGALPQCGPVVITFDANQVRHTVPQAFDQCHRLRDGTAAVHDVSHHDQSAWFVGREQLLQTLLRGRHAPIWQNRPVLTCAIQFKAEMDVRHCQPVRLRVVQSPAAVQYATPPDDCGGKAVLAGYGFSHDTHRTNERWKRNLKPTPRPHLQNLNCSKSVGTSSRR